MAEWTGRSVLSFPKKAVISRSQGCKDMVISVAVWLPEKQQQKTQSGCNCYPNSSLLWQLGERWRDAGDGWLCSGCSSVPCVQSSVICWAKCKIEGAGLFPLLLEEEVALYIRTIVSRPLLASAAPDSMEIHKGLKALWPLTWAKGLGKSRVKKRWHSSVLPHLACPLRSCQCSVVGLNYLLKSGGIFLCTTMLMLLQRAISYFRETSCRQA